MVWGNVLAEVIVLVDVGQQRWVWGVRQQRWVWGVRHRHLLRVQLCSHYNHIGHLKWWLVYTYIQH